VIYVSRSLIGAGIVAGSLVVGAAAAFAWRAVEDRREGKSVMRSIRYRASCMKYHLNSIFEKTS
jgi:hypothetical protein